MSETLIILTVVLSPLVFIATAIASWFQPGFRPKQIMLWSKTSTIISLIIAAVSCFYVFRYGLVESGLIGIKGLGLSLRLDSIAVIMLGMIALLGFIIIKFSINYLDGDQRQGAFIGRLSATIASVQLLVLSGNLGLLLISWILTSISLHRLLVFYRDRPGARFAAKKKFILARAGDLCLLVAVVLLYHHCGSGNLEVIFTSVKNGVSAGSSSLFLEFAALFLAIAAILKSAQFPTHGWLIEVMETPTPVSALLHAGLLNAGPFLIIRMAFVMDQSTVAPILLICVGGFTALFASVSYLTQTSVKTALGYSSVGHMGFSLLACGLGVYSAAMLHLVAHSFYKSHAFLASGSVIDLVKGSKVKNENRSVGLIKVALGIVMALALYTLFALIWGIDPVQELSLLAIGAVIVMGVSRLFVAAIAGKWRSGLMVYAMILALLVTVAFFSLESATNFLISTQVPSLTLPGWGKIWAASLILFSFGLVVCIQILAPQLSAKPYFHALAIHVRNGFYTNALFDRIIGALKISPTDDKKTIAHSVSSNLQSGKPKEKELKKQLA